MTYVDEADETEGRGMFIRALMSEVKATEDCEAESCIAIMRRWRAELGV